MSFRFRWHVYVFHSPTPAQHVAASKYIMITQTQPALSTSIAPQPVTFFFEKFSFVRWKVQLPQERRPILYFPLLRRPVRWLVRVTPSLEHRKPPVNGIPGRHG